MVTSTLVDKNIEGGRFLVEALDDAGMKIDSALWLYSAEDAQWRLLLSSPDLYQDGPRKGYSKIQPLVRELEGDTGISLGDITIFPPTHPILKALKMYVKTGPGMSGIRLSRNTVDGLYIEDAYIYRLV